MKRECTCHGMNENCCFCSGSGYIEGARTMTPSVPIAKIKRVKSRAEQRFERQLAKPRKLTLPLGRQCPHCKREFPKQKALTHHIISDHADVVQVFRCSNCTKPFLEEFAMNSHMQSCRKKRPAAQPVGKHAPARHPVTGPQNTRGKGARPNTHGSVYQDLKKERPLDGSRGSHMFRDQGRFGSHSSHDDYGDNSKP